MDISFGKLYDLEQLSRQFLYMQVSLFQFLYLKWFRNRNILMLLRSF